MYKGKDDINQGVRCEEFLQCPQSKTAKEDMGKEERKIKE